MVITYSPSLFPTTFDAGLLRDTSVLITGGASGLGAAFARKFAEAGAFVTIADINRDAGTALETELTSANFGAKYVYCDVTSWKSQTEAFKTAISSSPSKSLDTVVAAAGLGGGQMDITSHTSPDSNPTEEDPPEPSISTIQVNLFGVYYTTQLAIYYMGQNQPPNSQSQVNKNRHKSIILVGSLGGYHAIVKGVEYTISKYGVRGMLKSLRGEMKGIGIRLNIIAPTYIKTPMLGDEFEKILKSHGVQFAEIETAVMAVMVLATNSGIDGRAIAVGANGNFDLRDDHDGLNAGLMLKAYGDEMNVRREASGGVVAGDRFFYL